MATGLQCVVCQSPAQYHGVHGQQRLPYCSIECYQQSCPGGAGKKSASSIKREQQAQELIESATQLIRSCTKQRALDMARDWQVSREVDMSNIAAPEERPELVGLRYNLVNPTDLHRYFISQGPEHLAQMADRELRRRLILHSTRALPETIYGRDRWTDYSHAVRQLWLQLETLDPCRERRLEQLQWVQEYQNKHLYHHLVRVMRTYTATCPADVSLSMRFTRVLMGRRCRNGTQALQEYWNTWIQQTRYGQSGTTLQQLLNQELIQQAEYAYTHDPWRIGDPGTQAFYEVLLTDGNPLAHHPPPAEDCGARLLAHSKQHMIERWLQPWIEECGPGCTHTPLWMWLRHQMEKHWEQVAVSI